MKTLSNKKVADVLVGTLVAAGVKNIYGLAGDSLNGITDSLRITYRNQLCTFNDDIQGTGAVATGTLLSAINVTGIPLNDRSALQERAPCDS